jgi:hypothetical protein
MNVDPVPMNSVPDGAQPGAISDEFPDLVDTSYGVEGGCSVSNTPCELPLSVWVGFAMLGMAFRRRSRP